MILFISPNYGLKSSTIDLIKAAAARRIDVMTLQSAYNEDFQKVIGNRTTRYAIKALYGEVPFCEFVAQEFKCILYSNKEEWITQIAPNFLKRLIDFSTLEKAKYKYNRQLYSKVLECARGGSFMTGTYNSKLPNISKDANIIIHEPVEWAVKYRFVIINGKIATYSCYKLDANEKTESISRANFIAKGITAPVFAESVLKHASTAPACIMDIGFIRNSGWSVIGSYPVWSSDPYGCDPDTYLKALFASCETK